MANIAKPWEIEEDEVLLEWPLDGCPLAFSPGISLSTEPPAATSSLVLEAEVTFPPIAEASSL